MRATIVLPLAACVVIGCADQRSKLVGVWEYDARASKPATNATIPDALSGAMTAHSTLEFNSEGRFKATVAILAFEGNYSLAGEKVTLVGGNENKRGLTYRMSSDGTTLTELPAFESDGVAVFRKRPR